MTQKPRIFISYAWENKDIVRRLERELRNAGLEVWVDDQQARAGDNLPKRISDALEWCTTLILLWSKEAAKSPWVEDEWTNAHSGRKQIIPCLLDGEKLPFLLRNRLYIQVDDFDNSVRQLLAALNVQRAALPTLKLRSHPLALSEKDIGVMIHKYDFYCGDFRWTKENKNLDGKGISNALNSNRDGKVVYDATTGLAWQQSGSENKMDYTDRYKYIKKLNHDSFASFKDWRLPTLEEAMSLMKPEKNHKGLYIDPIFDGAQKWIWTADKVASNVCLAVFSLGIYGWGSYSSYIIYDFSWVRAVRS